MQLWPVAHPKQQLGDLSREGKKIFHCQALAVPLRLFAEKSPRGERALLPWAALGFLVLFSCPAEGGPWDGRSPGAGLFGAGSVVKLTPHFALLWGLVCWRGAEEGL